MQICASRECQRYCAISPSEVHLPEQPDGCRQAAAPRHAETARVVNDDEVDTATLGKLRRNARAGAGADNNLFRRHALVLPPVSKHRLDQMAIQLSGRCAYVAVGGDMVATQKCKQGSRPKAANLTQ